MQVGDLVRYMTGNDTLGIIIGGPTYNVFDAKSWEIWWVGQHAYDGKPKMGWWDDDRLEVINESR